MGVGDGLFQAATDTPDGGGSELSGGSGGLDTSGGVGVEAATVVFITLLAVLGNAMVVATLVRRSLLHHPSNRLVLSLTGSNLILTVVVLPGMVTSLLMTPAFPSNLPQLPTLHKQFNDSGKTSTEDSLRSMTLLDDSHNAIALPLHSNLSSSGTSQFDFSSSDSPAGFVDGEGIVGDNSDSIAFSSELPLYMEISSGFMNHPVSLYNHRDVSLLSQELQDPEQIWHLSTVNPLNFQSELDLQESMAPKELDLTLPRDEFSEVDGKQHINSEVIVRQGEEGKAKEHDSEGADSQGNYEHKQRKDGKGTRSISGPDHKVKYLENYQQNGEGDMRLTTPVLNSRKDNQPHLEQQNSKSMIKQRDSSKIVHQESESVILADSEILQRDLQKERSSVVPADHPDQNVRHILNRKRKQETRHFQHRKQRLRRKKEEVNENEPYESEEIDTSGEKRIKREHRNNVEGRDSRQGSYERQVKEVQVRIEQQQGAREHVVLVRGAQHIDEEEGKQMLLVVVDQEGPGVQHQEHQRHVQVEIEQHLEIAPQVRDYRLQSSAKVELKKAAEEVNFSGRPIPKLPVVDKKSGQYHHHQEQEDQLMQDNTTPDESSIRKNNTNLIEQGVEVSALRLDEKDRIVELPSPRELPKRVVNDDGEKEVSEVQQLYGGVEWESDRWEGGKILCQGAAFFTNLVTAASALTVAVIAIDRYLAIVRPLVYGVMVTRGRCLLMLIWCWSQALLTALPPLLGWAKYERREPYGRCGVAWGDSPSYTAVWTISVFLIPFTVMIVCYYHILQVARNKCRRIRVGKVSESSPPNTPYPAAACLDGFPFPLSVTHLTSPPMGAKLVPPCPSSPTLRKLSSFGNLLNPPLGNHVNHPPGIHAGTQWNGSNLVKNAADNGAEDLCLDRVVPCRSYSVSGMLRAVDSSTNTNDTKLKRKLGDFGRSRSLCQVPQQPPRPCLRRVQSTFSVRHTLKKLSLGTRRSSWNWEGSPSKGFWTVFVVMGAHLLTWGPYTCMAIAEAILGREHLLLLPSWVMVTCTILLFTASVFYPIVYGLYNRNIRKELLTCLCPTWARRRGSHVRRPSTLPSYSGSVLDFTSIRHRNTSDKPELCHIPAHGIASTIATISSTVGSLACPTPLMIMAEDDSVLPTRGYNLNLRKPSQDSGTVMIGGDDQDSDADTLMPPLHQHTTRRVSAPSVLSTVREDPHTTVVCIEGTPQINLHHSMNCRNRPDPQRKMTILPLSVQLLSASPVVPSSMRRSRSLDKIHSDDKDIALDSKITYRSLRKKRTAPVIQETQFSVPPANDRVPRRRGSLALMKVTAIPEDCGLTEYPKVTDSGRGSADSGNVSRPRITQGRGSVDSSDLTKTFSLRCRGSVNYTEVAKAHLLKRRGSVDSTELALSRSKRQENRDSANLGKNPASRHVSIDEGIGGDCLPEETNFE